MRDSVRSMAATAVAVAGVLAAVISQAQATTSFNLPAQSLADSLRAVAGQTNSNIIFDGSVVAGKTARPLEEDVNVTEALESLLSGTGLTYRIKDEKTAMIVPMATAPATSPTSARKSASPTSTFDSPTTLEGAETTQWRRFRLAQAENRNSKSSPTTEASENKSVGVEEIVVTAQKRRENLQDVPISISVLSGAALDGSTVEGVTEALSRVPGVAAPMSFGVLPVGSQLAVRGVAATEPLFSGASPIAYYLDSAPFTLAKTGISPDSNAYDLERVEVLRGPQGTLYGASALNGVVRVLTHDADLNELQFKARTSIAGTEGGGESYRADMAANVPIVKGKLAARAVAGYQNSSGWIDTLNKRDVNDAEIRNMRLKVLGQPNDRLSIGLSAWLSRADYAGPSVSSESDPSLHAAFLDEPLSSDYDIFGLEVGYEFSGVSVASTTSSLDYASSGRQDRAVFGFPNSPIDTQIDAHAFSQEVIFSSTHEKSWRWSLGGIYRDAEDQVFQFANFIAAPLGAGWTSKSFAVFGEVTRIFLDGQLELTGGLRYFEDDAGVLELSNFTGAPPLGRVASSTFDKLSPRVVLTWHPSSQQTVYASYAEGFRSGGLNNPPIPIIAPDLASFDPDTLKNYELGAKGSALGGRLNYDTAIYYIEWEGAQQALLVDVAPSVRFLSLVNAESVSGIGFDLGLTTEPVDGLTLGVNVGWNDLEMNADVLSGGVVLFAKGDRSNYSAETTGGASVGYVFPLGANGFKGRFAASANYTSVLAARRIVRGAQLIGRSDPMLIARTSFSVDSPNRWAVTLFVDNINNEQDAASRAPLSTDDLRGRVRPRTFGLQLDYHF